MARRFTFICLLEPGAAVLRGWKSHWITFLYTHIVWGCFEKFNNSGVLWRTINAEF